MEEKLAIFERELLKLRQEKEVRCKLSNRQQRLSRENTLLYESKSKAIEEYKDLVKKYEERIAEKDKKVQNIESIDAQLQEREQLQQMSQENKENGISLLQHQIEQLQQTVLKKQLLLDACNSEKSSLEYRLADALRDKARVESMRRGQSCSLY